ncbi:MAG: RNA methyltransferase [Taibaiella sp.]|nr:RNA methyltransferase [Taibaiella sp.]
MLSKAQNKYIRSLALQKNRNEHNVFIAEGAKIAGEWLHSTQKIQYITATKEWMAANLSLVAAHPEAEAHIVTQAELETLSIQQTPNQVILAVHRPPALTVSAVDHWCIALDTLQDPGNMGTIIRIADWFGIKYIACSPGCVDVYNPKVVQAAMGGHLRVNIFETDLAAFVRGASMPLIAATLGGESIYSITRPKAGILVIGNESKGITPEIQQLATTRVTIPRVGGAESLNAGVSAGILCALLTQS